MDCRILKNKKCQITQKYSNNHKAVDIVGENNRLDDIIAHSDGVIIEIQDGIGNMKGSIGSIAYGNYVKINHGNGYYTLYGHMKNNLPVKKNQNIKKGETIGYMGDSGDAYGKHLHFELFKDNQKIDPTEYLNKDLPSIVEKEPNKLKYQIGDIVEINGVYISSTSKEKLRPLITKGKITRIAENVNNPYLLENGKIGWVNDSTVINKISIPVQPPISSFPTVKYLSNKTYTGTSIVDALKEIKIDSSYNYRKKLANLNNINNYQGTSSQNTQLLNLLKQGLLKY